MMRFTRKAGAVRVLNTYWQHRYGVRPWLGAGIGLYICEAKRANGELLHIHVFTEQDLQQFLPEARAWLARKFWRDRRRRRRRELARLRAVYGRVAGAPLGLPDYLACSSHDPCWHIAWPEHCALLKLEAKQRTGDNP